MPEASGISHVNSAQRVNGERRNRREPRESQDAKGHFGSAAPCREDRRDQRGVHSGAARFHERRERVRGRRYDPAGLPKARVHQGFGPVHACRAHPIGEARIGADEHQQTARPRDLHECPGQIFAAGVLVVPQNDRRAARQPRGHRHRIGGAHVVGHINEGGQGRLRPAHRAQTPCRCCQSLVHHRMPSRMAESGTHSGIAAHLEEVRTRIKAAAPARVPPGGPAQLVAVSKTHGADAVEAAIEAGQLEFGENRVQEAAEKFPALKRRYPTLVLHLIGPLQTNKLKEALALFDVIQTVDREKLADRLAAAQAQGAVLPRLYVQVNTGEEPQKAGIPPVEAVAFVESCRQKGLTIEGLMCIPPAEEEPALHFALLSTLARRAGLAKLSMGMSADFETAVALGASYVRVGSAIFGARA